MRIPVKIFSATLVLMLISVAYAFASPVAFIENNNQKLGKILEGEKPQITFTISNNGDETLKLTDVHTTCGCTVAELTAGVIAPGSSVTVIVTFDSRGYSGEIRKAVTVTTNDPQHGSLSLAFEGEVFTRFEIEPSVLYLRDVEQDKGKVVELIFQDNTDDRIEITDLKVDDRRLTARAVRTSPVGSRYRAKIVVTVPPGLPLGSFDTHLKVKTNDRLVPGDSIYIIGKIVKNRQ